MGGGVIITERDYAERDKLSFEDERLLEDLSKEFQYCGGGSKTDQLIYLLKKKNRKVEWNGLVNHKASADLEEQLAEQNAVVADLKQSNDMLHSDNMKLSAMCKRLTIDLSVANDKLKESVEPLQKKIRTMEKTSAGMRGAAVKFEYLMGFLKKAQETGTDCFDALRQYAFNLDE